MEGIIFYHVNMNIINWQAHEKRTRGDVVDLFELRILSVENFLEVLVQDINFMLSILPPVVAKCHIYRYITTYINKE